MIYNSKIMSLSNLGLDAFEEIAGVGTIVLAAKRLGVTQTALTQRIKALEAEIGTALFSRSRKGMELTPDGQILHKYCQERRINETRTIQRIHGSSVIEARRIRISGPTMQTQSRFLGNLKDIKEKYPHLYFTFNIDDSQDLLPQLKNNQADFVLTRNIPSASLRYKELTSSEFVLVGPYSWKNLNLKDIINTKSVIDFNEHDDYTISFLRHFKLLPKSLPERHFINNTHQMLVMVEKGLGYAVFDYEHVKDKIQNKIFYNLAPKLKFKSEWYLCWNELGDEINPVIQAIINKFD
jgi:DNA-binding transcriptional LysR family regulator